MSDRRRAQRVADAQGRLLVTKIDGRLAIVLPRLPENQQAAWIKRIVDALEQAGIGILLDPPS